jgi:putative toxin-antitoxin system antitoxin component (TIGR02293 family)
MATPLKKTTKKIVQKKDSKRTLKKSQVFTIASEKKKFEWSNNTERVEIIRKGIPYQAIEVISERIKSPVKSMLILMDIPQTTYNKKKSERSLLDSRDSELLLLITELLDYGVEVFNFEEEKFQRWLKKPNLSLNGQNPESLFDTVTGIEEVRFALNRIEFGMLA